MKIAQLLVGLDQYLHVDNAISNSHKEADRILLNWLMQILIDDDNFDEERNRVLIPLLD